MTKGRRPQWLSSRVFLLLALIAAATLLFFLNVIPIVGYAYRFCINYIVILYIFLSYWTAKGIHSALSFFFRKPELVGTASLLFLLCAMIGGWLWQRGPIAPDWNIHRRAKEVMNRQFYVQLGEFLKSRLAEPENATLVYGEAGTLPYAAHLKFVDNNGLTEPYIARLYGVEDPQERVQLFTEYVLGWEPDVIAFGGSSTGRIRKRPKISRPFNDLHIFSAYRDHGYMYLCSMYKGIIGKTRNPHRETHDMHFLMRAGTQQHETLRSALLEFAQAHGYVLPEGLVLFDDERDWTISIPPIDK